MSDCNKRYFVYQASDVHIRCSKSYGSNKEDVLHFTRQLMRHIEDNGHLSSETVILLLGDIFDKSNNHLTHTGTIVSTFKQMLHMMKPCTVLIIPGNHDIPRDNTADDIITACLKYTEYSHVLYRKNHGLVYTLDDSIRFYHHPVVLPDIEDIAVDVNVDEYFNIGLFHEQILERSEGKSHDTCRSIVEIHKDYDLYLVGDAHNRWTLPEHGLVYSGAPIQHRMGESIDKYFVYWTIEWDDSVGDWMNKYEYIPLTVKNLFIHIPGIDTGDPNDVMDMIDGQIEKYADDTYTIKGIKLEFSKDTTVNDIDIRNSIIEEYNVKPTINIVEIDECDLDIVPVDNDEMTDVWELVRDGVGDDGDLLEYHGHVLDKLEEQTVNRTRGKRWQLLDIQWSNVGCYGGYNSVDFRTMKGMIHLRGKNSTGKSTFIDVLLMGLYGTSGGGMSIDTILNNVYTRGNYSILVRFCTPDDGVIYTVERYGTRKSMKHKLTMEYSDGMPKRTVEGARSIDTYLSTVLPSIDGGSSYSLLTSTCIALQDRPLNITDIKFNVVDDLDRVIDDLSKELNSNTNRVQMPDIPGVSKDCPEITSLDDCTRYIRQYETELEELRGQLVESSKYNSNTVSQYSQYSTVDVACIDVEIATLSTSIYPDSDTVRSDKCINGTLEDMIKEMDSLNLGTRLTDKSEDELKEIVQEYKSNTIVDDTDVTIPIALRTSPYSSNSDDMQTPSVTVLERTPILTKYYTSIHMDSIDTELDRLSGVLRQCSEQLQVYEEYCSQNSIVVPSKSVKCNRPELVEKLIRVEYRSKPEQIVDTVENIYELYREVLEYEEYCSRNSIAIPSKIVKCNRPELNDHLVRVEYRSKPSGVSKREYTTSDLDRLQGDMVKYSEQLQAYEEYCSQNGIAIQSGNGSSNRPELNDQLVRVEYRNKPKYKFKTVPDNIEIRIENIEELLSKSCRVNPTLLCTECKERVECMSDDVYEENVKKLEKYRQVLDYKLWLQYDEYSKYTSSVSQYVQYLRTKIKTIESEIKTVEQYIQWKRYSEYEEYVTKIGQYTAYIRSKYNASVQYRDWLQYEEYNTYVTKIGQYTAYLRNRVKEYSERVKELTGRRDNHHYEKCHDYYWHINRRRLLENDMEKYRHDLDVIRDKRRKTSLEYSIRALKYRHNHTVKECIKELESRKNGRLYYDRCVQNISILDRISTIENRLHTLDEWSIYYKRRSEYDEWNRMYTIKRRYLTILEDVRDSRLEYCRSTVENVCNEMLHNVYGDSKRVVISRDTDSKRASNKYRIILEDNGRIVRRMAHSIKFIIDILIRCALIRFNSNLPNFMIIDEGFGALDIDNALQFWTELKGEMSRYLDYTIVIDHGVVHDDDLIKVMNITTDGTVSTLQYP